MTEQEERRRLLRGLLDLSITPEVATEGLAAFHWDSQLELVIFTRAHLRCALLRFLKCELSAAEVAAWAEAIECREDIGDEHQSLVDVIYELATPECEGELTRTRALALLWNCGEAK